MKALIIDDNDDARSIAAMSLSILGGMDVIEAANGHDGIKSAEQESPDLILLDMVMPTMDGSETHQKLQQNPLTKAIPVILMAPANMTSEIENMKSRGVAGIVTKPFDPSRLPMEVLKILQR